jgi:hypothetical protein
VSSYNSRVSSDSIGECRVPSHHVEGPNRDLLAATAALLSNDLPQVELQKFDGSPLKWCELSLTFKIRIHENPALSVSKKLVFASVFNRRSQSKNLWLIMESG